MSVSENRLFYLDFIRAIALMLIIVFHFNTQMMAVFPAAPLILPNNIGTVSFGEIGVGLFVILSGASLTVVYGRNLVVREFYRRRFVSLFPMYWVAYIVALCASIIVHGYFPFQDRIGTLWLTLIGMDGFLLYKIPDCYLVGEWFFGMLICLYAVYPLLRIIVNKAPGISMIGALVWLVAVHSVYNKFFVMEEWRNPLIQVCFMIFGMAFARQFQNDWRKPAVILAAAILAICAFDGFPRVVKCFLVCLIVFNFLVLAAWRMPAQRAAELAVRFIGKYSFPVFLIHHIVIYGLVRPHSFIGTVFERWILFFLVVILSFAAGIYVSRATAIFKQSVERILAKCLRMTKFSSIT